MTNKHMRLRYSCTNKEYMRELMHIKDNAKDITYKEFISELANEDIENLKIFLGYDDDSIPKIEHDPYVECYKSINLNSNKVHFIVHSSIEYIFY